MNMRTTLMLMAATIAPIYAQEQTGTAVQIYQQLATPAACTTATTDQRASAYSALALIPADSEFFFTINRLEPTLTSLVKILGHRDDEVPAELAMLDSFSIGIGDGLQSFCRELLPLITYQSTEDSLIVDFCEKWGKGGNTAEPAASIIKKLTQAYLQSVKEATLNARSSIKLPPIYAVLTGKSGSEELMRTWKESLVGMMNEDIDPSDSSELREPYTTGDFSGIIINLKGEVLVTPGWEYDEERGEVIQLPLSDMQRAAQEELDKRSIYVVLRQQGTQLVAIVCENPEDIALPATPAESVLGTDKVAAADARLASSPVLLSYSAPGSMALWSEMQLAPYSGPLRLVTDIFTELSSQPGENQTGWASAAKSADFLLNTLSALCKPKDNSPELLQLWLGDGSIELEYKGSSQGYNYLPGKLALTSLPDKPGTIFYTESSPYTYGIKLDANTLIDSVISVADGMIATLTPEAQQEIGAKAMMVKTFAPDLKDVCSAFGTMFNGMGNSTALTIDSAGSMPLILGGTPGNKTAIPRISFYTGVTDRTRIAEGWDQLLKVAANVCLKLNSDPSVINMLPIVPKTEGNTTSYSVAMPWFTPDMVPNVTLNDTAFTIGTSANYNAEVVTEASGNMDFTGCVATLKFRPLATTARGIANELAAIAAAQKAPIDLEEAPTGAEMDDETDEEEDFIEEEDYEEEDAYVYRERSPEEMRAEQAEDIADALEMVSSIFDRVDAVSTTDNGSTTLRMRIKLRSDK